eukprot:3261206-Pyramimonas_sp.AAC.1
MLSLCKLCSFCIACVFIVSDYDNACSIHAFPFREESREIEVGRFLEGSSKQPRFPEYNAITLYKPKKTKVSLCRNSNHGTFKFTPCRNLGAHSEVTQITTAPKIYFNRVQLPWFPHLFTPYSLSKLSSRFLLYSEDQLNFNASLCELNVIRIPSLDYAVLNHFEHKLHDQKRTENLMKKVYAIKLSLIHISEPTRPEPI